MKCDMSPWLLGAAVMRSCAATPSLGLPSYHEKAQEVPVMSRHAPIRINQLIDLFHESRLLWPVGRLDGKMAAHAMCTLSLLLL